jgi:hypothetical protein
VTRRVTEPDNFHGPHFTRTRLFALASVLVKLKPATSDSDLTSYMVTCCRQS